MNQYDKNFDSIIRILKEGPASIDYISSKTMIKTIDVEVCLIALREHEAVTDVRGVWTYAAGTIADRTWRQGFLHLTVDAAGLVSLWDDPRTEISYLKLPLTTEQRDLIETTMRKGGPTP